LIRNAPRIISKIPRKINPAEYIIGSSKIDHRISGLLDDNSEKTLLKIVTTKAPIIINRVKNIFFIIVPLK
jgi:hypothetical protein